MPKATSSPNASKVKAAISAIRALESCVAKDHAKLLKAYPQALAELQKEAARTTQELQKHKAAQKAAKAAPKQGGRKTADPTVALTTALQALNVQKDTLQLGHKKLQGQQKALQAFEKQWAKQQQRLQKQASRKATRRKTKAATPTNQVTRPTATKPSAAAQSGFKPEMP